MTKDEKIKLLDTILKAYVQERNATLKKAPTFLEIIGKSYNENYISRILSYIMKNDYGFVANLLNYYFEKKSTQKIEVADIKDIIIVCEKAMFCGRADIFAKIEAKYGEIYTLTIENKINSGIHSTAEDDDQTKTYYNYVIERYGDNGKNAFLLLKPYFNQAMSECDDFKTITYGDIIERKMITIDDSKTNDFIEHIEGYLYMKDFVFNELDRNVIENLGDYREILKLAEEKIVRFKNWLFSEVSKDKDLDLAYDYYKYNKKYDKNAWDNAKNINRLSNDITNDLKCCKFYKNGEWYRAGKSEGYWFYVEIKFEDNDPNKIVVQSVIKRYDKSNKGIVTRFFASDYFKNDSLTIVDEQLRGGSWAQGDEYYLFNSQNINKQASGETYTSDWQASVRSIVAKKVKEQIKRMDEIYTSFKEWEKEEFKQSK